MKRPSSALAALLSVLVVVCPVAPAFAEADVLSSSSKTPPPAPLIYVAARLQSLVENPSLAFVGDKLPALAPALAAQADNREALAPVLETVSRLGASASDAQIVRLLDETAARARTQAGPALDAAQARLDALKPGAGFAARRQTAAEADELLAPARRDALLLSDAHRRRLAALLGRVREASRAWGTLLDEAAAPSYPTSVWKPLSKAQKAAFRERYLEHLGRRDGEPDWTNRVKPGFTAREAFFKDLEARPVRRAGPPVVDAEIFKANEEARAPQKGLDERALWALAMAKGNRTEFYGVQQGLDEMYGKMQGPNDPMRYIGIEEFYHTRVLRDALEVLGLKMADPMIQPHPTTAWMLRRIVGWPKPLANVLIMCAEVAGVAVFKLLAVKAAELFPDQEGPQRRIQELMQQILVDEVGHVHYVRSQLGPLRLLLCRLIMPLFVPMFTKDIPELSLLFGRKRLMREILRADVDGASAWYADRFVPAAPKK